METGAGAAAAGGGVTQAALQDSVRESSLLAIQTQTEVDIGTRESKVTRQKAGDISQ